MAEIIPIKIFILLRLPGIQELIILDGITDGVMIDPRGHYNLIQGHHHCNRDPGNAVTQFLQLGRL